MSTNPNPKDAQALSAITYESATQIKAVALALAKSIYINKIYPLLLDTARKGECAYTLTFLPDGINPDQEIKDQLIEYLKSLGFTISNIHEAMGEITRFTIRWPEQPNPNA